MDWSALLSASVPALIAFIGAMVTCIVTNNKTTALIVYRLEAIEKRLDKNDDSLQRLAKIEERAAVYESRLEFIHKTIDELKAKASDREV